MLNFSSTINVKDSINSGQVFLWEKFDSIWYGINGQNVLSINENDFSVNSFSKKTFNFFRKDDDYQKILNNISKDKTVKQAVKRFPGLRLMRQDPFQCYISFIVSSNSNIQNIKLSLTKLCEKFGDKIEFDEKEFFLFPEPKKLANSSNNELLSCGLGYRAKFVKKASTAINSGEINFELLKKMNYFDAKEALIKIFGIGNKVADCILLFSLEKLDAFPLDRWMLRILEKYYDDEFNFQGKTITEKKYEILHDEITNHFGIYAGYSQQFLFKMERELNQKKWL